MYCVSHTIHLVTCFCLLCHVSIGKLVDSPPNFLRSAHRPSAGLDTQKISPPHLSTPEVSATSSPPSAMAMRMR